MDAKNISGECILILDVKPVSAYDEKAVSSESSPNARQQAKSSRLIPLLPLAPLCLSQKGRYVDCGSHGEACWFPKPEVNEGVENFLGPSGLVARDPASEAITFLQTSLRFF